MNTLIIGSQGFIGSSFAHFLLGAGYQITGCDITEFNVNRRIDFEKVSINSPDFETLFNKKKFDLCINASGSGKVAYSIEQPISDFDANTVTIAKVLDTIRKYQPHCKYLHISSAAIYGNPSKLPIDENARISPLSPYGFHKWMSEIICQEYHQLYQLPIAVIRPFSVYGNGLRKQLLWDICQKLHQGSPISLFGTGGESRDFIHISDLAELIMQVINHSPFQNDIYNAASGTETSIRSVADIFESLYPGQKKISFSGETKPGDPIHWKADISRALQLGFEPKMSLLDGIRDYIKWYTSQAHE